MVFTSLDSVISQEPQSSVFMESMEPVKVESTTTTTRRSRTKTPSSSLTDPQSSVFMESMEPVKDESTTTRSRKKKPPPITTKSQHSNSANGNKNTSPNKPRRKRARSRTNSFGVPPKSAAMELASGMFVYLFCVSFPTIMGVIIRLYQNTFRFDGTNNETNDGTYNSSLPTVSLNNIPQNILRWTGIVYLQKTTDYSYYATLSDVQFVALVSVILAVFRVFLIYVLVPRGLVPKRVEALVRCKSTNLLSSTEYRFEEMDRLEIDDTGMVPSPKRFRRSSFSLLTPDQPPLPPHLEDPDPQTTPSTPVPPPPRPKLRRVYSLLANAFRLSIGITKRPPAQTPLSPTQTRRLRSAPRFATAVFRFSCCAISTTWCLLHFRSANFWPVWVGGGIGGATKNCWDLSGSVADLSRGEGGLGMDSDFDLMNSSLRYFFLVQASYQMHSLCFHGVSMVLLALYGGDDGVFVSIRSSVKSYFLTILEHLLGIALVAGAFLFSGVRRLGAIAIFALEASSLSIQLLQICINAPADEPGSLAGWLRSPRTIRVVHRFVTVPIFVYCRMFVVPVVVLYSSLWESRDWIRQIERAMEPGFGAMIYYFFNGLLVVVFALNVVFLRRLLFHPHVRQILSVKGGSGGGGGL